MLRDALKDYYKNHHVEASVVFPMFYRLYHSSRSPQIVRDAVLRIMYCFHIRSLTVDNLIRTWFNYGRMRMRLCTRGVYTH